MDTYGGTSIDQLKNLQQLQQMQQMQQLQQMQQTQQMQQMQQPQRFGNNQMDMIAQDITESLDENDQMNQPPQQIQQIQPNNDISKSQKYQNKNQTITQKIPESLREPLLLIIIYVILSLNVVKDTIGEYIPQIKSKDNGVPFMGYLLYGTILAITFVVLKKLLL